MIQGIEELIAKHGNIPALSIKQPWAWLIVNGYKDIENRDWPTRFAGKFYVHTGKNIDKWAYPPYFKNVLPADAYEKLCLAWPTLPTGGIVGISKIIDCVSHHPSVWFEGDWGFVLDPAAAQSFDIIPYRGKLGFFNLEAA